MLAALLMSVGAAAQTLPFHLPEGSGSFRLGLTTGGESVWLDQCKVKPAKQDYTVTDKLWKGGEVVLAYRPLSESGGFILEVSGSGLPEDAALIWAFGACDETLTATPTDNVISPASCADNVFSTEGNAFIVYYGKVMALRVVAGVAPLTTDLTLCDAHQQDTPLQLLNSGKETDSPVIASLCPWEKGEKLYFCFYHQTPEADYNYYMLSDLFNSK